ncbi:MFS general substrate transporter [Rickenella mellea]|uniref:MFS general substrate transporter n=1 Tax=Rickenella mellea TaxID=50990 RepID=A0A4Y7QA99_9AGAM|nr:MFS general substrate transporter [Rickenella mellea]
MDFQSKNGHRSKSPSPDLEEGIAPGVLRGVHQRELEGTEKSSASSPKPDVVYIEWEQGDPRNPANYSYVRKWVITLTAAGMTGLSAAAASTYALGYPSMIKDLNCTQFQATLGLSLYPLGFGVVPLFTAALSEEFGRQPLYLFSTLIFLLTHLGIALSKNIQSVLIFRFIAGAAGSTGATMVGGTVADIWSPKERGVPMSIFAMAAIGATGLGPAGAGWIEMDHKLEWRWIQWIHLIVTAVYFAIMPFAMKETRSTVLLTRVARKMRRKTGDPRWRARAEDERGSLSHLIYISCTRPLRLLLTEPVVASFSLWISFAWGILYALIESVSPAFKQLHHFNQGETGTAFLTLFIGSVLGYITNLYQERIYQKRFPFKHQEARLYAACFSAILFPVAVFIYAWTSFENVHWMGMAIGITLFIWALFAMYLSVFTYLADCYGPYASSALAGQSLCRNVFGTIFPLFTTQMYDRLGFPRSSTLFACIAILMAPIPFVLFRWGPQIRSHSKFAKHVPAFGS